MRKIIFCLTAMAMCGSLMSQVTIGSNSPPDASAVLDLQSTSQGLLLPRLDNQQRNAIVAPAVGLAIYNTETRCAEMYLPSGWKAMVCDCNQPPPPPIQVLGPVHVCPGDTAVLFHISAVPDAYYYQWSIPNHDTLIGSASNDSILVNFSNTSGAHVISVQAVNTCGSSGQASISINVSNPVAAFSQLPLNPIKNNAVTFTTTTPGVTSQWTFTSGSPGASGNLTENVTWSNAGTYQVTLQVTDNAGCMDTVMSNVTVANCIPVSQTFTNCAATGRNGPNQTQCNTAYGQGVVTVVNGIQRWTAPFSGTYTIEAAGGQGGGNTASRPGGLGAKMRGNVTLNAGDVVNIVVGQQGNISTSTTPSGNRGGGGGSFVWKQGAPEPIIAAGGGGGTNVSTTSALGINGSTNNSGALKADNTGTPGANGNGATPGGAGFKTNSSSESVGTSPIAIQNGATGGDGYTESSHFGGFGGGGGGGGGPSTTHASGGGGGYSGGAGQGTPASIGGGGGGSYIDPAATNVATSNGLYNGSGTLNGPISNIGSFNTGNGYVIITFVCPP